MQKKLQYMRNHMKIWCQSKSEQMPNRVDGFSELHSKFGDVDDKFLKNLIFCLFGSFEICCTC